MMIRTDISATEDGTKDKERKARPDTKWVNQILSTTKREIYMNKVFVWSIKWNVVFLGKKIYSKNAF